MRDLFLFAPREPRTSRPRSHRPPRRRFGGRWLQGDARPPPPPVGGAGERGPRKSDGPGGAPPPPRPGCSCACELPRRRVPAGEGGAGLSWQRARKGRGGRRLLSSGAGRVPATEGLLLRDVCIWLLVQLYCTVILKLCECGSKICSLHCMSGRPYEHQLEFAIERNTFVIPELRQLQYSISHKIWLFTRIGLLCVGCA
uniref:uncharacterized protein LOC118531724 isoform X3 n=1 Tax=Halichoerus grypus TaxID=9711 RepID=UPI001658F3E4|nr:uncharacterized protein LOC118531724 isoform X3 [Halichoerus grypus]